MRRQDAIIFAESLHSFVFFAGFTPTFLPFCVFFFPMEDNLSVFAIFRYMGTSIINRKFRYTYSNVTLILVCINVFVFFVTNFVSPSLASRLAMNPISVRYYHSYYTFVTYMFVHGSLMHLFSNMLGLIIFGPIIERKIGSREFLLYYMLTGTLSGAASYFAYLISGRYFVFLLGASGAVYAVTLLFALFFPNAMIYLFGIVPLRAWMLAVLYFVLEFFGQFAQDGVAHATHLFGLLFGLLYALIRLRINPFAGGSYR